MNYRHSITILSKEIGIANYLYKFPVKEDTLDLAHYYGGCFGVWGIAHIYIGLNMVAKIVLPTICGKLTGEFSLNNRIYLMPTA